MMDTSLALFREPSAKLFRLFLVSVQFSFRKKHILSFSKNKNGPQKQKAEKKSKEQIRKQGRHSLKPGLDSGLDWTLDSGLWTLDSEKYMIYVRHIFGFFRESSAIVSKLRNSSENHRIFIHFLLLIENRTTFS